MATVRGGLIVALVSTSLLVAGPGHARPTPSLVSQRTAAMMEDITAIYNFGDSLSDTGNLLREGDASGVLQYTTGLPYGSAIGGATGRCSDGYLMIDFLAKDLGLPLLNPYLDKGADFTHGANFAVAGATALDAAALARRGVAVPHTNSSLAVQLRWFKDLMRASTKSPEEIREKLARSLVMVGEIGGNDYNYAFAANKPRDDSYNNIGRVVTGAVEAMSLVPDVVRAVTGAARELLRMGATRLVIPGNFPLGCVPSYLSSAAAYDGTDPAAAYDADGCHAGLNLFAQAHNALLREAIGELRASYPAATIAYADYFGAYVRMLRDFAGFDEGSVTAACCGAGGGPYNVDLDRMCGAPGATVCARPDERLSWDGVHLTQRAYRVMTDLLYHGGFASPAPVEFPHP